MDAEIIIIKRPARNAEYKILHIIPPCDLKEPAFGKGTRIDKAILAFFSGPDPFCLWRDLPFFSNLCHCNQNASFLLWGSHGT